MKISVEKSRCTGQGRCYSLAPNVFEPDDEGFNAAIGHTVEVLPGELDNAKKAVLNCPERALTIEDE